MLVVPWQVSAVSQMSWYVCFPTPTPVVAMSAIQGNLYVIIQMIGYKSSQSWPQICTMTSILLINGLDNCTMWIFGARDVSYIVS